MTNTPQNYEKQIKNAKRHIEHRGKPAEQKHIRAKLRKAKKELEDLIPDEDYPLYRAGFNEAISEAIKKINEVMK